MNKESSNSTENNNSNSDNSNNNNSTNDEKKNMKDDYRIHDSNEKSDEKEYLDIQDVKATSVLKIIEQ